MNMTYILNKSQFFMEIERNFSPKLIQPQESSSQVDTIGAQNNESRRQIIDEVLALKAKKSTDMTCRRLFTTGLMDERLANLRRAGRRGRDGVSQDAALHAVMWRMKRFVRDTRGHKENKEDRSSKKRIQKQSHQFNFNGGGENSGKLIRSPVGDLQKIRREQTINSLNEPVHMEQLFREHSHRLKSTNSSTESRNRQQENMQNIKIASKDTRFNVQDTEDEGYGRGMLFMEPYYELAKDVPSALYPNLTTVTQTRLEQVTVTCVDTLSWPRA